MAEKKRNAGVELLRIFAMLLIILHHFARHIDYAYAFPAASFNSAWTDVAALGGNLGVNIFLVITGYFSCNSKFSSKKIARLVCQVTFYNVVLAAVSVLVKAQEFRLKMIPRALFSFVFAGSDYWFFNMYLILYICMPLINSAVKDTGKRRLGGVIAVFFCAWTVLPYIAGKFLNATEYDFSRVGWFILMYLVGCYLRKFPPAFSERRSAVIVLLAVCQTVHIAAAALAAFCEYGGIAGAVINLFSNRSMEALMPSVLAVLYFLFFRDLPVRPFRCIFPLGLATFGVYLCHNNEMTREFMWYRILRITDFAESKFYMLYSLGAALAVFAVCAAIEILRERFIERPLFASRFVSRITEKTDSFFEK